MTFSTETLRLFLHDELPERELAEIEQTLRSDPAVRAALEAIREQEDRGEHSVGAIWKREHLTCPSRDHLGAYLLQAIDDDHADYITFHLQEIACGFCSANLEDLKLKLQKATDTTSKRRRRRIADSTHEILRNSAHPS
jgi:hypothetical protein